VRAASKISTATLRRQIRPRAHRNLTKMLHAPKTRPIRICFDVGDRVVPVAQALDPLTRSFLAYALLSVHCAVL
jgi:hypothetical protein